MKSMLLALGLYSLITGGQRTFGRTGSERDIVIREDGPNAESLTSTAGGAVIFGSLAKAEVFRAAKGAASADVWIKPGTNGLQRILGVLADPRSATLWVCSSGMGSHSAPTALKTFDLESGEPKASYDFPGGTGLCNDIAIATDGTVYATDTSGKRVVRLKKGSAVLDEWISDPRLAGIDGIALGDDRTVYVNTFFSGHLVRIAVGLDGKAGVVTELNLSQPLVRPDGMRTVKEGTMLLAEGEGRLDRVTIQGDNAKVEVLREGLDAPRAVTLAENYAWVLVGGVRAVAVPVD